MILTEDDFDKKYTPNKTMKSEHFDDNSGRLETFGNDLVVVLSQKPNFVWTCVDGDDGVYLVSGYNLVNRIYYLISNEPWTEFEEYIIEKFEEIDEEE